MIGRTLPLVVVVALLLVVPATVGSQAADGNVEVSGFSPADVEHGDTNQTIRFGGRLPSGSTALTVDVTALESAGVDLSNATVGVEQTTPGVEVDPTLVRSNGEVLIRTDLSAAEETGFRLALRLRDIETTDAGQGWLRYEGSIGDTAIESDRFRIEPPGMPDLLTRMDRDGLVVDRRNASHAIELRVFDAPADTPVTVSVDLEPLVGANASIDRVRPEATVESGDLALSSVDREGQVVTLVGRTGQADVSGVVLTLAGVDTRGVAPTEDLRYPLTIEAPPGAKRLESAPFGVYLPGESPTPTETIVESPTATATPAEARNGSSPTEGTAITVGGHDAGQPGLTAVAALLALLVAVAVAVASRRDR